MPTKQRNRAKISIWTIKWNSKKFTTYPKEEKKRETEKQRTKGVNRKHDTNVGHLEQNMTLITLSLNGVNAQNKG